MSLVSQSKFSMYFILHLLLPDFACPLFASAIGEHAALVHRAMKNREISRVFAMHVVRAHIHTHTHTHTHTFKRARIHINAFPCECTCTYTYMLKT